MARETNQELTFQDIFRMMDEVTLDSYPNPDRAGCPNEQTLEAFARDPRSFPIHDPIFEHIAKCSPCLRFVRVRRRP
jgi:hypothetical protein